MPYIVKRGDRAHACSSLEEARTKAAEITLPFALVVQPAADEALARACSAIPESGGTVGPLPDGTTIQVEPCHWPELAVMAGWDGTGADVSEAATAAAILVAFNAKHAHA